jgi:perosamine synthetase
MEAVPVSAVDLNGNEERYVIEAMRSTWISSSGKFVARFEKDFADFAGTKYALAVSNGTVALHLALLGLGVKPGDEVLVPSLTYVATANAVRYIGAEPIFVDVDETTWCIDPGKLNESITPRTKGIIAVHLYGHPADMDEINAFAEVHGLWVVEDAAEAHGAKYKERSVGGLGRAATFSFYGNKILTSGEGGAITLDDAELYGRLKMLRGQGMDPERRFFFPIVGYNYRLTNVACAILCAQLERAEELISRRRSVMRRYREGLAGIDGIGFQPVKNFVDPAPWLFSIIIDEAKFGRSRDATIHALREMDVETRPFFIPLHVLPPYRDRADKLATNLPVTASLASAGMNLPTYSTISMDTVDRICEIIRRLSK